MQLVIESTGAEVVPGCAYPVVRGVLTKVRGENQITVQRIVLPNPDNQGRGLIVANVAKNGAVESCSEYYPSVIGAVWKDTEQ